MEVNHASNHSSSTSSSVESLPRKDPLPRVPGPKLPPFLTSGSAGIYFLNEIGDPSEANDGRVWKVTFDDIEGAYALKMVPTRELPRVDSRTAR